MRQTPMTPLRRLSFELAKTYAAKHPGNSVPQQRVAAHYYAAEFVHQQEEENFVRDWLAAYQFCDAVRKAGAIYLENNDQMAFTKAQTTALTTLNRLVSIPTEAAFDELLASDVLPKNLPLSEHPPIPDNKWQRQRIQHLAANIGIESGVPTWLVISLDEVHEDLMNKRQPITITTLSTRTGLSKRVCWEYLDIRSAQEEGNRNQAGKHKEGEAYGH